MSDPQDQGAKIKLGYIPPERRKGKASPFVGASISEEDYEIVESLQKAAGVTRAAVVRLAIERMTLDLHRGAVSREDLIQALSREK